MIPHIRVVLSDTASGVSALAEQSGRALCACEAATKLCAIEELELRLIVYLQAPFTLHIDDRCVEVLPIVKIVLEDVAISNIFVATAFDSDGSYLCDGASSCHYCAVDKCLFRIGQMVTCGMLAAPFQVDVEVLNPNYDE